ncbi:26S proteasome non-ATPase regulatory subunit 9 [Oryza brachyantha]|uniref:PDZ domain-containing protein n=1 Tax=Oryza brachyantha TaxID=4533 RepID=J3MXI3_ORYBR|nr:26S proteasome non-ATPase regulatory subunit 9 [Oryza brachyantha]XP_015696878.1 26S proteasome non-ATPase regulatory subunit 9 [Oryza brachyantha]
MVAPNVKAETVALMDRRAAVEAEMDAIIAALSAPGGLGITGGLVDAEGFPRSDIDIPAVLAQRRKLAELQNDHKDITNKIEKNLEVLHSTKLSRNDQSIPASSGTPASLHSGLSQNDPMEEDAVTALPFAIIDELTDGSPAALDGLQLWDEIVKFGNVEAGDRLQERLVSEALSNEDSQVSLVIIRQGSSMNLIVTPRKWHGRGLLGCHFRIL